MKTHVKIWLMTTISIGLIALLIQVVSNAEYTRGSNDMAQACLLVLDALK